jgi:hypothetical protein
MTAQKSGARDTVVSRSTKSRATMLQDSAMHIAQMTGRDPMLPSRPPPPPRLEDEGTGAGTGAASGATARVNPVVLPESTFLHINVWFEVVDEEAFVGLFSSDVKSIMVPRPRGFIPQKPLPIENVPSRDLLDLPGGPRRRTKAAPAKAAGVVAHVQHLRSPSELASDVIAGFFGGLLNEILGGSEVRGALLALPPQPKIPAYFELRERASLMAKLEKAFRIFDLDNSGKLSMKEIRGAIVTIGLKAKTSEVKAFMRSLDQDSDGEVDLKEFLAASMPPEVSIALEEAIDEMEYKAQIRLAEERRFARLWLPSEGGEMTADRAALRIQGNFRSLKARRRLALKKELEASADARELHAAANRLQGTMRGKRAREAAKERAARRQAVMRQVALADPAFQGLISDLVDGTVKNLLTEALFGEFDLGAPPKQYTLAMDRFAPGNDESATSTSLGRE